MAISKSGTRSTVRGSMRQHLEVARIEALKAWFGHRSLTRRVRMASKSTESYDYLALGTRQRLPNGTWTWENLPGIPAETMAKYGALLLNQSGSLQQISSH